MTQLLTGKPLLRDGNTRGCIQKFRDWPPEAITTNGTALCYQMQLYRNLTSFAAITLCVASQ
jgi:hypothetical protein